MSVRWDGPGRRQASTPQRRRDAVRSLGEPVGQADRRVPAWCRGRRIAWPPTRRRASRRRRCRWPAGLGMGFDPPVVSKHLPATAAAERLEPGMVLAVTGYVWEQGVGAVFGREAVLITADGPEVLTSSPFWQCMNERSLPQPGDRRWPATRWSTYPPGLPAPIAPSCSPTAAPTLSRSSHQKVIRCAGGRPRVRPFRPAVTGRCSAFWRAQSTVSSPTPMSGDDVELVAGYWPRRTRWSGRRVRKSPSTRIYATQRSTARHPHLTVTSITPFGLEGPWRDRAATEFTLQAWSGGIVGPRAW